MQEVNINRNIEFLKFIVIFLRPTKCQDITSVKVRSLPAKSFSPRHSLVFLPNSRYTVWHNWRRRTIKSWYPKQILETLMKLSLQTDNSRPGLEVTSSLRNSGHNREIQVNLMALSARVRYLLEYWLFHLGFDPRTYLPEQQEKLGYWRNLRLYSN